MLILHRSERADQLVDALGRVLEEPLADPVVAEVVSVPTRGVERWITQRLSHHLGAGGGAGGAGGGVCANLEFPFPGRLVAGAAARAVGVVPEADPWAPERSVWDLISVVDDHSEDPRLEPLLRHLRAATPAGRGGEDVPPRRFALARHLADLFDRYGVHRPEMVRSWVEAPDPSQWQSYLWWLLRRRIGVESPAERLPGAIGSITREPAILDLPERLSVFGLTRLPAGHLQVLSAIGAARDVHLYLLHPSGVLWDRVAASVPPGTPVVDRVDDPTRRLAESPLLRSWGRDAREMQVVLAAHGVGGGRHYPVADAPASLLGRMQSDIRADRAPEGEPSRLSPLDGSVRVHACHGRTRQVEVLRDAILHLLREDPTLEVRDVIVMCPDIEAFAPLIQAAFAAGTEPSAGAPDEPSPGLPALRVRLADRALRQTNPLLGVAGRLLDLAGSRVSASAVLDLAASAPVSRRFGLDREELALVERWVADTGIHWGFDAAHREHWGIRRVGDSTWAAGLDRLLLGVAMTGDGCQMYSDTVPYGDLPSSSVDLAGRFAELVHRLCRAVGRLEGPQALAAWTASLVEATESVAECSSDESWQLDQLRRTLSEAADEAAGAAGGNALLALEEIRSLLAGRLAGRPTRANFRTGDLTFCTLVPMRSVPHRVVALLGLDDGVFPRHVEPDGDDLLLHRPRVGDREPRAEDRQLLLDAVLAATDHLIITYSGKDERTNRPRPPCAPVAELLDVVDATAASPTGGPARDFVVVSHPLQGFDRRNFTPGLLGTSGPWSFDPVHLDGARASTHRHPPRPWLEGQLPAVESSVLQVHDLVAFVQHPVRAFLRQRLSLYLTDRDVDLSDALPLELDPLQKWAIGDRLLEAGLAGVSLERAVRAEERRGLLPPPSITGRALEEVRADVESLLAAVSALGLETVPAGSREVRLTLRDGRLLVGAIPDVRGSTVTQFVYSRLGPKHRLAAWVRFLALTADGSGETVAAVSVGKGSRPKPVALAGLDPVSGSAEERRAWALDRLERIVELYDLGMRGPLPLACRTSAAWAEGRRQRLDQPDMIDRAQRQWEAGNFPGEADDEDHLYVFGRGTPFLSLLSDRPSVEERRMGWPRGESTRFGGLARLLWDPLLDVEKLAG